MSACPGCGSTYRKGSTVLLLDQLTGPRNARVCQGCVSRGIVVVAPVVAIRDAKKSNGRVRPELDGAIRQLTTYAKLAGATADKEGRQNADGSFFAGRQEGFEGAIALLRGVS